MRIEPDRRLHRDQREQLEQMVRDHVAQCAGRVVEAAAMADAELFVDGDLDVIDMVAIPDRLEDAVGKAQHQDVLHRLLAEIVIDPVDLVLGEELQELFVQRLRRGEIGAERLLDHQPSPRAVLFAQQADAPEFAGDRCEGIGRGRQIEQPVAAGVARGFQPLQSVLQSVEGRRLLRIGLDRGDAFEQPLGDGILHRAGGELLQALHQAVAQGVVRHAPCARCRPRRTGPAEVRRPRDCRARG